MMEGRAVGQSGHQYRYCQVATSRQVCASGCTADYLRSNNIALAISRWSVQHYEESRRLEGLVELCKEKEYPGSVCPGSKAADRPGTIHTMYCTLHTTHYAAWHTGGATTSAAAGGGAGEASLYSTHYTLRCLAHEQSGDKCGSRRWGGEGLATLYTLHAALLGSLTERQQVRQGEAGAEEASHCRLYTTYYILYTSGPVHSGGLAGGATVECEGGEVPTLCPHSAEPSSLSRALRYTAHCTLSSTVYWSAC